MILCFVKVPEGKYSSCEGHRSCKGHILYIAFEMLINNVNLYFVMKLKF